MSDVFIKTKNLDDFSKLSGEIKAQGVISGKTWAMATSPSECLMLKVNDGGQLTGADGKAVALDEFYEVVVFCADWQITATRNGAGADVEIITEPKESDNLIKLNQQYLVWGKVKNHQGDGWCEIADPRIGHHPFPSPENVKTENQLILTAREYIKCGEHGNARITRQRLTGIGVYEGDSGNGNTVTGGNNQ